MKIKIGFARQDHSACNWAVTRVGASVQRAGESNLRSNSWRCVRVDSAATTIRTTRETILATGEKSALLLVLCEWSWPRNRLERNARNCFEDWILPHAGLMRRLWSLPSCKQSGPALRIRF